MKNYGYKNEEMDYVSGCIGVPITFLDKFSPEQFKIIGMGEDNGKGYSGEEAHWDGINPHCVVNGKITYKRIFIKNKKAVIANEN